MRRSDVLSALVTKLPTRCSLLCGLLAGYHPPHAAAVQPPMVAGAAPITPQQGGSPQPAAVGAASGGVPTGREDTEQTLRVSRNSSELLAEMLAPVKSSGDRSGLQEQFLLDLVDQCYRWALTIVTIHVCASFYFASPGYDAVFMVTRAALASHSAASDNKALFLSYIMASAPV